jgi:ABC-2 type transport system permease protein
MSGAFMTSIFAKTLWDRRRSTVWWMLGLAALAAVTAAFYPSIRDDAQSFEDLFDAFPEPLLALFGVEDVDALLTATGLMNSRLYAGVGPIVIAVLGISLGTSAIAGEEEAGTLDLLLAQPVTRTQVVVEKLTAAAVVIIAVMSALFLTLSALNPLVGLDLSFVGILAANTTLGLFGLVFVSLTLAIGGLTGNRSLTTGIGAGVAGVLFFVNGLAPLIDEVAWLQRLTPYYWLQDPNPLANGFDLLAVLVLVAIAAALVAVAVWGFNRRDIGT